MARTGKVNVANSESSSRDTESITTTKDAFIACINHAVDRKFYRQMPSCFFGSVGLHLNIAKISWMANTHCNCQEGVALKIRNVLIPRSDSLIILGCVVCIDWSEGPALRHRMHKAGDVLHRWSHILTCSVPLQSRVLFWAKVVLPSLTGGVRTLRAPTQANSKAFAFCQKLMLR